jgi:hypothetical protein
MRSPHVFCAVGLFLAALPLLAQSPALGPQIAKIKAIGKEGQGHLEAMAAWKEIVGQGERALTPILVGLNDASPLAANWLRSAFETVVQNQMAAGRKIDPAPLAAFLSDTKHAGAPRRLAYETLVKLDPTTRTKLAATFLDDPGSELRRDAVDLVLKEAQTAFDANDTKAALPLYQKALQHARDKDQVKLTAERLKKLGVEVDLTKHLGFVTRWWIIGPFDNSGGAGFTAVYPPEKGFDLKVTLTGKGGEKVAWKEIATAEPMGMVDFNKLIGELKGVVGYAYATVESPAARPIEVRCGSNNAVRFALNGKEIFFREEYHHGMEMDQHVGKGMLKAGKNEILVKVCQNEQTDTWANLWSFQLRVCDHLGEAIIK